MSGKRMTTEPRRTTRGSQRVEVEGLGVAPDTRTCNPVTTVTFVTLNKFGVPKVWNEQLYDMRGNITPN